MYFPKEDFVALHRSFLGIHTSSINVIHRWKMYVTINGYPWMEEKWNINRKFIKIWRRKYFSFIRSWIYLLYLINFFEDIQKWKKNRHLTGSELTTTQSKSMLWASPKFSWRKKIRIFLQLIFIFLNQLLFTFNFRSFIESSC